MTKDLLATELTILGPERSDDAELGFQTLGTMGEAILDKATTAKVLKEANFVKDLQDIWYTSDKYKRMQENAPWLVQAFKGNDYASAVAAMIGDGNADRKGR